MSPAEDLPPEQPGQPGPQQPGEPGPQQPGEPGPQQPGEPGPQQPGEPGPEQPGRTGPEHPTNGLDETVHQRHRLGILTITGEAQRAEFGYLREALGLTPGNLSKHLTVLEQAGMVEVEKGYAGRRPRTWVRITSQGRAALAAELATLTELLRRHATTPPP